MGLDKARLALIVMGVVVVVEIVGIIVLGVVTPSIDTRVLDLLQTVFITTLTALGAMVGAQALNGKVRDNKEVIEQMAQIVADLMEKKYNDSQADGKRGSGIHL
jgi:hypothetical protein